MSTPPKEKVIDITLQRQSNDSCQPFWFNAFSLNQVPGEGAFLTLWHYAGAGMPHALFHARLGREDLTRLYKQSFESYLGRINLPDSAHRGARMTIPIQPASHTLVRVLEAGRAGDLAEITFLTFSVREATVLAQEKKASAPIPLWIAGRFACSFEVHKQLLFALFEEVSQEPSA